MNGLLVIDKPAGLTSFDVVRQVRRLVKVRRVGHAGTLDPLATGVLPVAVGAATRLIEYLMGADKTYRATLQLGSVTDTQDAEGRVIATGRWQAVDRTAIDVALAGFSGAIEQLPPMYSALKKDGQPLYKLARQGIAVERTPRLVTVHSLVVDAFDPPHLTFTARCSKGTYIRTLCHDIGQALGCGAHMTALQRLGCGRFTLADCTPLATLQELAGQGRPLPLLPLAEVLADWPALVVADAALERLRHGVAPAMAALAGTAPAVGTRVRLLADDSLVALARYAPGAGGKSGGDFELLKVFPDLEESG